MDRTLGEAIGAHRSLLDATAGVLAIYLEPALSLLAHALVEGHKVLLCGNGGSAMDAEHIAAELVVRFVADRRAYPAIALNSTANLTACGNDYGYDRVFSRQVEALGQTGDVLIAISTSGKSRNALEAIAAAKRLGLGTIGLSGASPLGCDVDIAVPSVTTARIQEMHILIGHLLVEGVLGRIPQ